VLDYAFPGADAASTESIEDKATGIGRYLIGIVGLDNIAAHMVQEAEP